MNISSLQSYLSRFFFLIHETLVVTLKCIHVLSDVCEGPTSILKQLSSALHWLESVSEKLLRPLVVSKVRRGVKTPEVDLEFTKAC